MKIWAADGEAGLMAGDGRNFRKIGPPGEALCLDGGRIFCAGAAGCHCYSAETEGELFCLSLPTGICALCPFGRLICALSQDADCICAFCRETGEMRFSVPAGNYPRDICPSPCGRFLAAAGGAAGEILLFDQHFSCRECFRVPGWACGVCFLPRCMMALCAVEDGDLTGRLIRISPRGVTEEICAFPAMPCCLCALPGGRCLAGCQDQAVGVRPNGSIFYRLPCAYPARIRYMQGKTLICDPCGGAILNGDGKALYRGPAPMDGLMSG